jgi:hypothetical protein
VLPANYLRKNILVTNGEDLSLSGMQYMQNTLLDYREKLKERENQTKTKENVKKKK